MTSQGPTPESENLQDYLESSEIIDWHTPDIRLLADVLVAGATSGVEVLFSSWDNLVPRKNPGGQDEGDGEADHGWLPLTDSVGSGRSVDCTAILRSSSPCPR